MSDEAYRAAGVDLAAQEQALSELRGLVRSTFTSGVLSDVGSFGGLYRPDLRGTRDPILVASADGVGTKLEVARLAGDFSTVGRDLVNHCVNDILVQGARPLFFLDYVGAGVLEPARVVELVRGVASACRDNGCALLGGETAEMPGFYRQGDYELVGFIVGLVDGGGVLDGSRVRAGDLLVGLPSAGLHTNGYSLARRVLFELEGLGVDDPFPGLAGATVGEVLLAPHLSYLDAISPCLGHPALHALAHITGGGLTDNLPRVLPVGHRAVVDLASWQPPEVFERLQELGGVERAEMLRVFNMGIGMVAVLDADRGRELIAELGARGQAPVVIGRVEAGAAGVAYEGGAEP